MTPHWPCFFKMEALFIFPQRQQFLHIIDICIHTGFICCSFPANGTSLPCIKGQTLCSVIKYIWSHHHSGGCFLPFPNILLARSINLLSRRLLNNRTRRTNTWQSKCSEQPLDFLPRSSFNPFFLKRWRGPHPPPLARGYIYPLQKDAAETRKDTGHPAKSQVCGTLQSQKAPLNAAQMKAPISARRVSIMAPALQLLLIIHAQP